MQPSVDEHDEREEEVGEDGKVVAGKREARRRLVMIEPSAVAFVDRAANLHRYLIRKRLGDGATGEQLSRATVALEKLVVAIEGMAAPDSDEATKTLEEATAAAEAVVAKAPDETVVEPASETVAPDGEVASDDVARQVLRQIVELVTETAGNPTREKILELVPRLSKLVDLLVGGEEMPSSDVAASALAEGLDKAVWSTSYVNDLPDSAFLYVESGGKKDSEGKTVPRSLRHFPYKDKNGSIDLPHLRNAIARIPQSKIPGLSDADKAKLQDKARALLARQSKSDDGSPEEQMANGTETTEKEEATSEATAEVAGETATEVQTTDVVAEGEVKTETTVEAEAEVDSKPEVTVEEEEEEEETKDGVVTEDPTAVVEETKSEAGAVESTTDPAPEAPPVQGTTGITLESLAAMLNTALTEISALKETVAKSRTVVQTPASAGLDSGVKSTTARDTLMFPQNYNDPAYREALKKRGAS